MFVGMGINIFLKLYVGKYNLILQVCNWMLNIPDVYIIL